MKRRDFLKVGLAAGAAAGLAPSLKAWVPQHNWHKYDFGPGPEVKDRLYQGPFPSYAPEDYFGEEPEVVQYTMPGKQLLNAFGMGMTTYISGDYGAPHVPGESLETTIDKLFRFPLGTKVHIRPNWRHIQKKAGKLDFDDYWKITFDKAAQYGKRVCFRVMLNNPDTLENALPDYVLKKVPLDHLKGEWKGDPSQPRFQHGHYQPRYNEYLIGYFEEIQHLLADRYNGSPLVEFVDTHMFGFWGEGHAWPYEGHNFANRKEAEDTFLRLYEIQQAAWTKVPLVTNVQPDHSGVGNSTLVDRSVRDHNWLRRDTILVDSESIEQLCNRPAWTAAFVECAMTRGDASTIKLDPYGRPTGDDVILHAKDAGANYYSLWSFHSICAENLEAYYRKYPEALDDLAGCIGYRVRPSFIWHGKDKEDLDFLIIGMTNDGIAGVPGVLRLTLFTDDGEVYVSGCLDAGYPDVEGVRSGMMYLPKGFDWNCGRLRLKAELEVKGVRYQVPFAVAEPLNPDGSLTIKKNNR
ncbi:MAG: twin-arginine translocation signal domain-containing protein [Bacteroidales bacterium]|nr:twin-arginine translocation signal domain-containing protein [Bacteroidales bacterium]